MTFDTNRATHGRIAVAVVVAVGIGMAQAAFAQGRQASGPVPTFTKDVAPIFQKSCQRCHRPGSIGPMSLLTYEDARPWARSIKARVVSREMPPWHIDRTVGIQNFVDDPSLTTAAIDIIVRWVDAGSPRGNPADMPPPVQWAPADRWEIGEPDLIVTLKNDMTVAAAAADQWFNIEMNPHGLTEDRYIKAIEIKPIKGVPTVHHANASYIVDEDGTNAHLVEFAVGKGGEVYPDDSGKLLPKNGRLMMNLHLHANGESTPMNVALGLKLHPAGYKPKYVHVTRHVGDAEETLDIPAGASDVRTEGHTMLQRPTRLTAFQPHLHNRGKRQCLEAIYPPDPKVAGSRGDVARSEMLSCANFHFAWHLQYRYADDAQPLLPAGTVLRVISWHDNSAANRYNPDPTNWVGFGQRTIDDMAFAWVTVNYMSQEDFDKAVSDRRAAASASHQQQQ